MTYPTGDRTSFSSKEGDGGTRFHPTGGMGTCFVQQKGWMGWEQHAEAEW